MIEALIAASEFCDQPANRLQLAEVLSQPCYFGTSVESLLNGLRGPFQMGAAGQTSALDAIVYWRNEANAPTAQKGKWVLNAINTNRLSEKTLNVSDEQIKSFFRMDLYQEANSRVQAAKLIKTDKTNTNETN